MCDFLVNLDAFYVVFCINFYEDCGFTGYVPIIFVIDDKVTFLIMNSCCVCGGVSNSARACMHAAGPAAGMQALEISCSCSCLLNIRRGGDRGSQAEAHSTWLHCYLAAPG